MTTSIVGSISASYRAAITKGHRIATLAQIVSGGTVLATFNVEPTSLVTVDRNSALRTICTAVLTEGQRTDGGLVIPRSPSDPFYTVGNEMTIARGITYPNGDQELVQMGVLGLETVSIDDNGGDLTVTITGADRGRALQRAGFTDVYVVPPGTATVAAIQALIGSVSTGISFSYNFADVPGVTGSTPLIYKPGEDPLAHALELADSIGCELFPDRWGVWTLIPIPDPSRQPVAWSYDEGDGNLATEMVRTISRANVFNYWIAQGQGTGVTTPVQGIAFDDNPASPTYIGGGFGVVVAPIITSPALVSQAQCLVAAQAAKFKGLGTIESLEVKAVPRPDHSVDDVIEATRVRLGIPTQSLEVVDSFTMGMGTDGVMDMQTRSIASVAGQ
jgi:hypothetical protein